MVGKRRKTRGREGLCVGFFQPQSVTTCAIFSPTRVWSVKPTEKRRAHFLEPTCQVFKATPCLREGQQFYISLTLPSSRTTFTERLNFFSEPEPLTPRDSLPPEAIASFSFGVCERSERRGWRGGREMERRRELQGKEGRVMGDRMGSRKSRGLLRSEELGERLISSQGASPSYQRRPPGQFAWLGVQI